MVEQKEVDAANRWRVDVPGWLGLTGVGATPSDALANLEEKFANRRSHLDKLPRPGTTFAKLEFASDARVSANPELREKFVREILDVEWAWISDESTLWEFHGNLSNDEVYMRIEEVFGVDVRNVESGRIADILERIRATNQTQ